MMNSDLRRRCEAIARLEQQRKELADEIKELKAAAKSDGYDVPLITKTVSLMLKDTAKQKKALDQHSLFDSYLSAVGLLPDDSKDEQAEPVAPPPSANTNSAGGLSRQIAGEGFAATSASPALSTPPRPVPQTQAAEQAEGSPPQSEPSADLSIPDFLRRAKKMEAA